MKSTRLYLIIRTIPVLIVVCFVNISIHPWQQCCCGECTESKYGGGTGEPNDPYLIYTAEQMNAIGAEPNDWDKHFRLMADIDLSGFDGKDGRPEFNMIAPAHYRLDGKYYVVGTPFTGVFDGNGLTISNLTITRGLHDGPWTCYLKGQHLTILGLFGCLEYRAEVRDLGVVDANINGKSFVGSLVGYNFGDLTSCYSTGTVSGYWYVGGLVGYNDGGSITGCSSNVIVNGYRWIGGLVGRNNYGNVTTCYSTGEVNGIFTADASYNRVFPLGASMLGNWGVGGLVGANWGGTLSQCYSDSAVSSFAKPIGGLVGFNYAAIVTQCYSTGPVSGLVETIGGLVGQSYVGNVTQCYSISAVNGSGLYVGGLIGRNEGGTRGSFWDIQTSGQSESNDGTGKTTAEMKMASTFLEAGWDFVDETENGLEDIWWIDEGKDYPRLWWEAAEE